MEDSAAFWSAVATLLSAAAAWFTYFGSVKATNKQTHRGLQNLIQGLETELELISSWAGGAEGNPGYLQSLSSQQLALQHPDWNNPMRQIFTFDHPVMSSLTRSSELQSLQPLIVPFARLNHSIRMLFESHEDYRRMVHSNPQLYQSLAVKLENGTQLTPDEQLFKKFVFSFNLNMHQVRIGGQDSTNPQCLYQSFREARQALLDFKSALREENTPWWFWILHVLAIYFFLNGLWQVICWFKLL